MDNVPNDEIIYYLRPRFANLLDFKRSLDFGEVVQLYDSDLKFFYRVSGTVRVYVNKMVIWVQVNCGVVQSFISIKYPGHQTLPVFADADKFKASFLKGDVIRLFDFELDEFIHHTGMCDVYSYKAYTIDGIIYALYDRVWLIVDLEKFKEKVRCM